MPNPAPPPPDPNQPVTFVPLPADFPLTPTLHNLHALDLGLAQHEQNLEHQLETIRAQRQSLQQVLQWLAMTQPDGSRPDGSRPNESQPDQPQPDQPQPNRFQSAIPPDLSGETAQATSLGESAEASAASVTNTSAANTSATNTSAANTLATNTSATNTSAANTSATNTSVASGPAANTSATNPSAANTSANTADPSGAGPASVAPSPKPRPAPNPIDSPKSATKRNPSRSTAPQQPTWRRYLKPLYSHLSLPDTITQVLEDQPDRVFAIAEITDLIFEGLPLGASMKAHDRVSHVLADGARRGQWTRPKSGHYQSRHQAKS
ncbi:MAG: hypothetical protein VKJ85_11815 [Prochlorothrix sp.]|nr:hypothetical protein [Prochlorothrix sp.]